MTTSIDQTVELLHTLGHVYARHGQPKRGLILLLIAARLAPDDEEVLRTLADSFLIDCAPQAAIAVLDRLQSMDGADEPALALLRGRALWLAGDEVEARRTFQDGLERRGGA